MKIAIPAFAGDTAMKINTAYLKYVSEAGYEPVLFSQFSDIVLVALECDYLLLPGGIDVEPTYYGEDNFGSHYCKPEKDDLERRAMRAFMAVGKKIFGICRGFQLMVREFLLVYEKQCNKMFFYQHVNNHALANDRSALRSTPTHSVAANVDALYGADENKNVSIFVNSIHHQALVTAKQQLSVKINDANHINCLAVTGFGAPTQPPNQLIVEAVDIIFEGAHLRGVQWHPEELMDVALLNTFFDEEEDVIQDNAEAQAAED